VRKTGVIATLPFGIADGRVLVIRPISTIRKGVAEALDVANPKEFLATDGRAPRLFRLDRSCGSRWGRRDLHDCNESDFRRHEHPPARKLGRSMAAAIPADYFDMVIVDEGHHNVATSWTKGL